MNPVMKNKDSVKKAEHERWIERWSNLEFTCGFYVNRNRNGSTKCFISNRWKGGWRNRSLLRTAFFVRSVFCICKMQKGNCKEKGSFHYTQRKSPAETIWICCESSWGKEGVEDSHQAPCHWWWQHLCYKAVGSPDAGCHLSRLVDGLTAFLMQDERRKETVTRKSAGSWCERLPAHARLNHTCKTTSGKMNREHEDACLLPSSVSWSDLTESCSFPDSHTSGTQLSGLAFYKQDDFHETGIQILGKFYREQ